MNESLRFSWLWFGSTIKMQRWGERFRDFFLDFACIFRENGYIGETFLALGLGEC